MLNSLELEGVGPAQKLAVGFTPRLNFLTGDNGLGKSFILDLAWWSLTRTWAKELMAMARADAQQPMIRFKYTSSIGDVSYTSQFKHESQSWTASPGRPAIPGVVIYAGVDGGFSVWDPARNDGKNQKASNTADRPPSFDFSPEAVWSGLMSSDGKTPLCNGLNNDWVLWQMGRKEAFDDLTKVLDVLSPSGVEKLAPGDPMRVGAGVKDFPSLRMAYSQDVPLILASAGMRRIAALAYLLVWTWREHQLACKQFRVDPAQQIIFLIDEIECHLHPQWQRRIVPALLSVMAALKGSHDVAVQLLVATHSPLVLASVEPEFDPKQDCIWDFALVDGEVQVALYPYTRKGDVNAWLASSVFNLKEPRSVAAEEALDHARVFLRDVAGAQQELSSEQKSQLSEIDIELRNSLGDVDAFWIRWGQFRDLQLGAA